MKIQFPSLDVDIQVRKQLQLGELDALAQHDELVQARNAGNAFQGWAEGRLTFPPTYKFKCVKHNPVPRWMDGFARPHLVMVNIHAFNFHSPYSVMKASIIHTLRAIAWGS